MSKDDAARGVWHEATHRLPGVPPHQDRPEGHQGASSHGRSLQERVSGSHQGAAPAHDRPPRVLVGWQNWIAGRIPRKAD